MVLLSQYITSPIQRVCSRVWGRENKRNLITFGVLAPSKYWRNIETIDAISIYIYININNHCFQQSELKFKSDLVVMEGKKGAACFQRRLTGNCLMFPHFDFNHNEYTALLWISWFWSPCPGFPFQRKFKWIVGIFQILKKKCPKRGRHCGGPGETEPPVLLRWSRRGRRVGGGVVGGWGSLSFLWAMQAWVCHPSPLRDT